jgi:hypothetical protein
MGRDIHAFLRVPTLSFDVVTISGDIIHNLRSSLDHLAKQLVLVGIEKSPPTVPLTDKQLRQIEFPIAETEAQYEPDKARKVKGMLPEMVEAIDRLKPYKSGNEALWRIHELDNIDKHRSLFTVAHDLMFTADWLDGAYLFKAQDPHFAGIEPKVEKDLEIEIGKAFSDPEIRERNALLPSLHQLVDFTENLILSFKPFLE